MSLGHVKPACRGSKIGLLVSCREKQKRTVDSRDSLTAHHLLALEFHKTASRLCSGIPDWRRPAINTTNQEASERVSKQLSGDDLD